METKTLEPQQSVDQKVQLVKGDFTASEASHLINRLIDEKINFHKFQRLQMWEGDHICRTTALDDRISQLNEEKEVVKNFISKARESGKQLKINGILEISIID